MTSELATLTEDAPRRLALLKAVGLDRLNPEQRELALNIATRYDLDLLLKHLVMIDGRPYITRDGLLHIAHRSGQLDGIETTEPTVVDGFWRSTCAVYRKDMSRPFTYTGRYPTTGGNQKYAPEMAVKVGEVMAMRRAFDVSAPTLEERWDVEVPESAPQPRQTLQERVAARQAAIATPDEAATPSQPAVDPGAVEQAVSAPAPTTASDICGAAPEADNALGLTEPCSRPTGHKGPHAQTEGSWPQ